MTCKEQILAQLTDLPPSWADQIATVVCDTIQKDIACEDVVACQTLTVLSDFSLEGSNVCINYTDELENSYQQCFDFNDLLNNSMNDVDPKCLAADQDAWNVMTFVEKWQAIVDKVCTDCE